MKEIRWNELKNERLKRVREASYEDILSSTYIGNVDNPAHPHQQIMLFEYRGYVWLVPCVVKEKEIFLKTLYPSRRYTKWYRRREK